MRQPVIAQTADEGFEAMGLKEIRNIWVYPQDEAAVREFVAKLQKRRQRKERTE